MRVAVMQPYVFPYLGYFQLIEACDLFVVYDDVNHIKRGWIHRNRILLNGRDHLFTVPLAGASQNKLIREIVPAFDDAWRCKFYATFEASYRKAPYYEEARALVHTVFDTSHANLAELALASLRATLAYLEHPFEWALASERFGGSRGMARADRLIHITREAGATDYVNAAGGRELYDKTYFRERGVELWFMRGELPSYEQQTTAFVPGLSILDVVAYNAPEGVRGMLTRFTLE